jgi:hypothetical protein
LILKLIISKQIIVKYWNLILVYSNIIIFLITHLLFQLYQHISSILLLINSMRVFIIIWLIKLIKYIIKLFKNIGIISITAIPLNILNQTNNHRENILNYIQSPHFQENLMQLKIYYGW